jgi:2-C-methyl-D-erythritol 4-phosphate cytidylyltransferase
VFDQEFLEEGRRKYGGHFGFSGVKVIGGGPKWIDQLAAATEKVSDEATHVLVHDSARPAVSYLDIESIMEAAKSHAVASLATPLRSPLIEVDEGCNALAFHPPTKFMHLVTPQVFSKEKLRELVKDKKDFHASQFTLIKGSPLNVRVGGGGDATLVKAMLNMLPKPKVKAPMSPFEEAQW